MENDLVTACEDKKLKKIQLYSYNNIIIELNFLRHDILKF